jgi:hypothetical protein
MRNNQKIFIAVLALMLVMWFGAAISMAQEPVMLVDSLPGEADSTDTTSDSKPKSFVSHLNLAVKFSVSLAALLAVVMIVISGFMYITAGGNTSTLEKAKDYMRDAILGLLLVLGSYLILNTINPDLVNMKLKIEPVTIKDTLDKPGAENVPAYHPIRSGGKCNADEILIIDKKECEAANVSSDYFGGKCCKNKKGLKAEYREVPGKGCDELIDGGREELIQDEKECKAAGIESSRCCKKWLDK